MIATALFYIWVVGMIWQFFNIIYLEFKNKWENVTDWEFSFALIVVTPLWPIFQIWASLMIYRIKVITSKLVPPTIDD